MQVIESGQHHIRFTDQEVREIARELLCLDGVNQAKTPFLNNLSNLFSHMIGEGWKHKNKIAEQERNGKD